MPDKIWLGVLDGDGVVDGDRLVDGDEVVDGDCGAATLDVWEHPASRMTASPQDIRALGIVRR
jgi:hypothetical protein